MPYPRKRRALHTGKKWKNRQKITDRMYCNVLRRNNPLDHKCYPLLLFFFFFCCVFSVFSLECNKTQ